MGLPARRRVFSPVQAFEVTVNHLLDAAVANETDELSGVTENVIVGQPIQLGTGDVRLVAVRQREN